MTPSVLSQIAELPNLTTDQLKEKWKTLFQHEPPKYNRPFIIKRLAYRIQENAYGGLSEATKAKLSRVLEESGHDEQASPIRQPVSRKRDSARPVIGTCFTREWKGRQHAVRVVADGYEHDGKVYRSLSRIAKEITGTNWNGPVFFGARSSGKGRAE